MRPGSCMLLAKAKRLRQESLKRTKTRKFSETRKSRTVEDKKVFGEGETALS